MTSHIRCFAPAKINLYLHITGKRPDGYHELDSLVVFANVGDTVIVEPSDTLSLTISGPFADGLDTGEGNLVYQAAQRLAEHVHVPANARITLEKNLPIASGIGGGSTDAAATLKALADLWKLHPNDDDIHHVAHDVTSQSDNALALASLLTTWRDEVTDAHLQAVGLSLGADVPVCLATRALYMGGIGELLSLAPILPSCWFVLVNPRVHISTPDVFKAWSDSTNGQYSDPARFHEAPQDAARLAELLKTRRNDLCPPAKTLSPVIAETLKTLEAQKDVLLARMSGSGATCFGLFADETAARRASQNISQSQPGWWTVAAKMITSPLEI